MKTRVGGLLHENAEGVEDAAFAVRILEQEEVGAFKPLKLGLLGISS